MIKFKSDYNEWLLKKCRNLGGKWDATEKCWLFDDLLEEEVKELEDHYNKDLVIVEIRTKTAIECYKGPITFLGRPLARAFGRDSGAKVCDGIAMTRGKVYSGGSMKNWYTIASADTTFKLKLSKYLVDNYVDDEFEIVSTK